MASPNSSLSLLYSSFLNSGPLAALIIPAVCLNFVAIIGMALNFSVLYITMKSSTLRGTTNFLLALISFYEVLHQTGHLLFLFVAVSGLNLIPHAIVLRILMPSIFGMNAAIAAITIAAADRLFAVLAENIQSRLNKSTYLSVLALLTSSFGIYICLSLNADPRVDPNKPMTGSIGDIYESQFTVVCFAMTMALNLIAIACYLTIWVVVKMKREVAANTKGRLLKSLLMIVLVNICGYFVNLALVHIIYRIFCRICYSDAILGWELSFVNGILLNLGVASNAPILYFTSMDYRKQFDQHFGVYKFLPKRNNINNVVMNIQVAFSSPSVAKIANQQI